MPAFAQVHAQVEVERAARAEVNRRARRLQPRAVRCDEHVGAEALLVQLAQLPQPGRSGFLARLEQQFEIEPQAPARLQHRLQRTEVDAVLALDRKSTRLNS